MANLRTPPGMNPRDKRPGDRRSLGDRTRRAAPSGTSSALLLLMALAQTWFLAPAGKPISYSEFKQAVRAGQVAEVYVGEQTIRGTYKRDANGSTQLQHRRASRIRSCSRISTRRA